MKSFGDVSFQSNAAIVMSHESSFPANPTVGRTVFINKRVWICTDIVGGTPTWIPLTNEIDSYTHIQDVSSATWTIVHNLNTTTPLVQVYNGSNNKMFLPQDVEIIDNNTVSVTVGSALVGRAVVMYGSIAGSNKIEYAYEYTQTTLANPWVITHNLGYYPIVRIFVGGQEIIPLSVVHTSLFVTTITFSMSMTGIARLI